jgi:hypothetical protein
MSFFLSAPVLAVFIAHLAGNYGGAMLHDWSPVFYDEVLGLPPTSAAPHHTAVRLSSLAVPLVLRAALLKFEQQFGPTKLQMRRWCIYSANSAHSMRSFSHFMRTLFAGGVPPWPISERQHVCCSSAMPTCCLSLHGSLRRCTLPHGLCA